MSTETKNILLRLPPELGRELEQALHAEPDMNATEMLVQGLVIRLRMPGKDKLPALLTKLGYVRRPAPGRPKLPAAEANGAAADEPAEPAEDVKVPGDAWNLDVVS